MRTAFLESPIAPQVFARRWRRADDRRGIHMMSKKCLEELATGRQFSFAVIRTDRARIENFTAEDD